ncbi:MAG: type II toxin-antitoxin system HicA family toxin [Chloroflexi bacterium]|nr:type II toxin-antitoxin system HicA family toxin [Chloroflexota bacterium]
MTLNTKQKKTYKKLFTKPTPASIAWRDIESLFYALGAVVREGNGSRVRVFLNDEVAVFHRPHPEKEVDKGAINSVRKFLVNAGIEENV